MIDLEVDSTCKSMMMGTIKKMDRIVFDVLMKNATDEHPLPSELPDEHPQKPYKNERAARDFVVIFQDATDRWWWRIELPDGTVKDISRKAYDSPERAELGSYGGCMQLSRSEFEQVKAYWGDRAMSLSELRQIKAR